MKRQQILIVCSLLLLVMAGCRSTRPAGGGEGGGAAAAPQREYTVISLQGTAEGISFNAQVRMAKDSIIWANATKVMELGRAMCTPDSAWVNVPLMGKQKEGTFDEVTRRLGVAISFAELQALLESPHPEEVIGKLAEQVGVQCTVRVVKRERVERLTFPYNKRHTP